MIFFRSIIHRQHRDRTLENLGHSSQPSWGESYIRNLHFALDAYFMCSSFPSENPTDSRRKSHRRLHREIQNLQSPNPSDRLYFEFMLPRAHMNKAANLYRVFHYKRHMGYWDSSQQPCYSITFSSVSGFSLKYSKVDRQSKSKDEPQIEILYLLWTPLTLLQKVLLDKLVSSEYKEGTKDPCKRLCTFKCGGCDYCQYMDIGIQKTLPNKVNFIPRHFANGKTCGVVYLLQC